MRINACYLKDLFIFQKLGETKNVQWEILSQTNTEYEKRLIGMFMLKFLDMLDVA
jgi:hypothetical protein